MKKLLIIALAGAFSLGAQINVRAEDQPAAAAPATEKKADSRKDFMPFRGVVDSVNADAKTITLKGEKALTLKVTDKTKLSKGGKDATFADIMAGDDVRGRAKKGEPAEAVTLKVGPLTEEEKAAMEARKAKKGAAKTTGTAE